jgi:phage baseplate assembly protein W
VISLPIASFSGKVFEVSSNKIYNFEGYTRSYSLDVEEQEQEGAKSSSYIKGESLETISFNILMDARFVDVDAEISSWIEICKSKKQDFFILGGKPVSSNKFLLKSISESDPVIDNNGKKLRVKLAIQLQEFVRYGKKKKDKKSSDVDYEQVIDLAKKRNNPKSAEAIAMVYGVSSSEGINWSAKGNSRILQNVTNLLNTFVYEVGYMRLMGLSRKYIDAPANMIEGIIATEVIDIIDRYEPRAKILDVKVSSVQDDNISIGVVVEL